MPRPGRSRAPRVLALACACAVLGCEGDDALPELALPPGDPGNLTGVWEGEQLLFAFLQLQLSQVFRDLKEMYFVFKDKRQLILITCCSST